VHPLWLYKVCQQGRSQNKATWRSQTAEVQGLRQEVHAPASEACKSSFSLAIDQARLSCMKQIIGLAFGLSEAVGRLKKHVKTYCYAVALSGYRCPGCNAGLVMTGESRARCAGCDHELDPTVEYQRCDCGGTPVLMIRRYRCRDCGAEIRSRFLFDGLIFDTEYFRQKMAESREHKRELRERVRQMLAESRSCHVDVPAAELTGAEDLMQALNHLILDSRTQVWGPESGKFDLARYQSHIQAHIRPFPISLREIPPLSEDVRKDLIWRFIALLFLDHAGLIRIWQDGQDIMVMPHETDTEGQGVPGDLEAAA
jgi:hypothetical protein